ncbi:MAG: hypothetical protein ACOCVF_04100 [bacterium]
MEEVLNKIKKILEEAQEQSEYVYDHGFPSSRLTPANFYQDCEDSFISQYQDEVNDVVTDFLSDMLKTRVE